MNKQLRENIFNCLVKESVRNTSPKLKKALFEAYEEPITNILSEVVKALREKAGQDGDLFICGGCLMDVCKFLGEEK
jgi:hypothetical protein